MNRVVITGLGVVSPIGNNIKTYWNNLINGICGIDYITRYNTDNSLVKIAAEVKNFEPAFFMDKNQIKKTDLYAQYALNAAMQAIQDSDIKDNIEPEKIGVYFGSGIGGISTILSEHNKMITKGQERVSPYFIPMIISNIAAGLIAIHCNAKGPCLSVVTACATSSHAIGEAYLAIKHGYADAIIAGGADAGINPLIISGFTNCAALSIRNEPKESSIPFDKRRDGFVMGEGAGAIVLEEYEIAKARNAKIYAEVVGYGNTCDAYHITTPNPDLLSCSNAIKTSLSEIHDYMHKEIYINAHGTSTKQNDKTETAAIKKVFGNKAYELSVSSTKSMTGHMLGAAGAVEAIATILCLNEGIIHPTIGYKVKDNECDLNYITNTSVRKYVDLGISISLGFGGHNACLAFAKY